MVCATFHVSLCPTTYASCLTLSNHLRFMSHTVQPPTLHVSHCPTTYASCLTQSNHLRFMSHTVQPPTLHVSHCPTTYASCLTQSNHLRFMSHTVQPSTLRNSSPRLQLHCYSQRSPPVLSSHVHAISAFFPGLSSRFLPLSLSSDSFVSDVITCSSTSFDSPIYSDFH